MTTRPLRQLDDETELAAARRAFIDAALETYVDTLGILPAY